MTGPEHYLEGERLLAESEDASVNFSPDKAHALAAQAQAHFLAALTASHAAHAHPLITRWEQAIDPQEQP